jgi:hypothetical protein
MNSETKLGHYSESNQLTEEFIDLKTILIKLFYGLPQSIGFACLGLVISAIIFLAYTNFSHVNTTTRVTFSFKGSSDGMYPDKSKFSYQDLIASDIIYNALKHEEFDTSEDFLNKIKSAIYVEGIIPADKVKARDRLIASGQSVPIIVPDEYSLNLNLPRSFPLSLEQRKHLLNSIVNSFRTKFEKTYAATPVSLSNLATALQSADYDDFERILADNSDRINTFLNDLSKTTGTFRSRRTKFSFGDLINENQDFNQIYKNKTLGLIHEGNLARDRKSALIKMDYQLYELSNLEKHQTEEERTAREFLNDAANHNSNYVLGVKSQITDQHSSNTPVLDKGLVDSLLANDTYSFIMKKALEASLKVKDTQVQQVIIFEKRKRMESALKSNSEIDKELINKASQSMKDLISAYENLVRNIQDTYSDYAAQEFSDSIRLSAPIETESIWKALLIPALGGFGLGGALGMGLSLIDINLVKAKKA